MGQEGEGLIRTFAVCHTTKSGGLFCVTSSQLLRKRRLNDHTLLVRLIIFPSLLN